MEEDGYEALRVSTFREYLHFEVLDTGIGISEENINNLFKLFGMLKSS